MKFVLGLFFFGTCALSADQLEAAVSGHALRIPQMRVAAHQDVKSAEARHDIGGSLAPTGLSFDQHQPAFGGAIKPPDMFDDRHAPDQMSAFVFGAFTAMSIYQMMIELSLKKHKNLAIGIGLVSFVLIAFTVVKLREVMHTYAYFSFVLGFFGLMLFSCLSYAYFYYSFEDDEERERLVRMQMFSMWLVLFLLQLWFSVLQDEKYILRMRVAEKRAIEAEQQAIAAEHLVNEVDREQQTHLERIRTLEHGFDYYHSSMKEMEERQRQHGSRIKRIEKHVNKSREDENAAKNEARNVIDGIVDDILNEWWPSHSTDGERVGLQ